MKKQLEFLHILLSLLLMQYSIFSLNAEISPHIITFFIRSVPHHKVLSAQQLSQEITVPGRLTKSIIKKEFNTRHIYSGIFVGYAGFVSRSDMHGQVIFPRKNAQPTLTVLITQQIQAVPVSPTNQHTITGFILAPDTDYVAYKYSRKQDPLTQEYIWHIATDKLPTKLIPWDAIIIFAKPQHIIITPGEYKTIASENLLLPTVYATEKLTSALNALEFMKVRQFFAPVKTKNIIIQEGYQERVLD